MQLVLDLKLKMTQEMQQSLQFLHFKLIEN